MKIDKLTQAQIDLFPEYVKKWTDIGLCTDPANRPLAEDGIKQAYIAAGLKPPQKIVWCDSPLAQCLTRAIVFGLKDSEIKIKPGDSVRASVRDSVVASGYGQHDASWLAFYDYLRRVCGLEKETQKLLGLFQIGKNAGWWLPHENICWVSERHSILKRDPQGRLHADAEMALQYSDGWGIYAYHGVILPEKYGKVKSEHWKSKWLLEEKNAELRRVLIQGIGYSRICHDLQAKKLDSWKEYELLRIDNVDVEPIVMVKMTCPSTGLIHAHRVDPTCKTSREAIKWVNNGIDAEEFLKQT